MNSKKFLQEVSRIKDISILMDLGRQYYSNFSRANCAQIFNLSIVERKSNSERKDSLKLMTNTALALFPFASSNLLGTLNTRTKIREVKTFSLFCERVTKCYLSCQITEDIDYKKSMFILRNFSANHLDYPEFPLFQYVAYLKALDSISYKVYGFSIYELTGLLVSLFAQVRFDKPNDWTTLKDCWISNDRFQTYQKIFNVTSIKLDDLFVEANVIVNRKPFPTDLKNLMKGKIGIRMDDGVFIPKSEFLYENLLHGLTESRFANNVKGPLLEKYVLPILKKYWPQADIHTNFYLGDQTQKGNASDDQLEQDFLIEDNDNIVLIECKSQRLVEVRRNPKISLTPIKRNFNSVIGKACQQLKREKDYIQMECADSVFTQTNRKRTFYLKNTDHALHFYKIVLTLDDFIGLAESANFLNSDDYADTWVTNVFYFEKILWKCGTPTKLYDYLNYRLSTNNVASVHVNELDQFGFFDSPNFGILARENSGSLIDNINIDLGQNFSAMFDAFDEENNIHLFKRLGLPKQFN